MFKNKIRFLDKINIVDNSFCTTFQQSIKLHPNKQNSNFSIYKKYAGTNIKMTEYDTKKLIKIGDIILTCWSSISIEAIIAEKPLIFINFDNEYPDYSSFDKEGSALKAYSSKELINYIKEVLTNKRTQEKLKIGRKISLKRHYYQFPGKSGNAILKEIKNYLNN